MSRTLPSIPALSDLSTDIANGIPPELVMAWAGGERDAARADALLAPYRREGTVTASDTVGLSRLTKEHELAEVLRMVSRPKEILHALGREVGGEAIGRWVADNSEMFFSLDIAVDEVVGAMVEVHRRLPTTGPRIGIAIHHGVFYHIGGGLYGAEADWVEQVAEEESRGGETLISEAVRRHLHAPDEFSLRLRPKLAAIGPIYRVVQAPAYEHLPLTDTAYPAPYSPDFYRTLRQETEEEALARYHAEKALLLVERCALPKQGQGAGGLLDELLANALLDLLFREVMAAYQGRYKIGGRLAIAVFDTVAEALIVAREMRRKMAANQLLIRAGIDYGPLLIFPMEDGRWEFAGDPVNMASKQAEDCGMPGWIYLSEQAAQGLSLPTAQRFEWQRSSLTIRSLGLGPESD